MDFFYTKDILNIRIFKYSYLIMEMISSNLYVINVLFIFIMNDCKIHVNSHISVIIRWERI